mmetsp:Transcript_62880/g.94923  ORF Transcript_62880/g.94923 Transcript_62880/m.94923 type:complete len:1297 (-) Transcript_62880:36-3926(-)|eukprot:CAMPEP_0117016128 /NCGR_PEP_ID=MMETSP0472-20121206/12749_1 /TAXON_ID=693140 ORGANISM="Tiarina fusus, Strain LIS" /NCGR_SAMPLE_ID=MMETSP0472 /ASSEMBLY_ACC=CAM_ASM_000603 /LENGTH=1296 /DNA_ID=CAMNT_0004720069 /DNA_START=375 /DNA_END=4265 /DNA_ORIENTATION=+
MMHHSPFNDESGIPMFGRNGTALSSEERAAIAKRRGLCVRCGTQTHQVKLLGRNPITNVDVYQGICIRCNSDAVPSNILSEWQARNATTAPVGPVSGVGRFRAAGHGIRYANQASRGGSHGHPSHSGHSHRVAPPPPAGMMNSEVTPNPLQRKSSHGPPDSSRGAPHHDNNIGSRSDHGGRSNRTFPSRAGSHVAGLHPSTSGPQHGIDSEDYKTNGDLDSWSLLKDIKDNRDKPDVLKSKLHGFRNLADDQAGALYEIKDIMDLHRSNSRFMMVSMGAVWSVSSKDDDKKQEATETGCLDVILDSLRNGTTKDDPETVYWALGTLASLANLGDNKMAIADKGGIEIIVEALKTHHTNATVFEWACRALLALVVSPGGSESIERNVVTLDEVSGLRAVINAMNKHIPESVAEYWALNLLFRLLDRPDPAMIDKASKAMLDDDLASICIKILKARTTTSQLFDEAAEMLCFLLSSPSATPSQRSAAVDCLPTAMRLMQDQQSNSAVQESCAHLLAMISRGNHQAKRQVSEGGCLRSILGSITSNPSELGVARAGMGLLWVLSSDETSFDFSLLPQIKAATENAFAIHPGDEDLNVAICGAVGNISSVAKGRGDSMPVDVVLRIMSSASTPAAGQQAGLALSAICSNFPDVADRLVEGGVCDQLLGGLYDTNVDVQSSSSAALAAIAAKSDIAKNKIFEAGGLSTASACLLTTASIVLAENLMTLICSLVTGGSKKIMQLPNELVQSIVHSIRTFPSLTKTGFTTIRNALLVAVPGFSSIIVDGLAETITGTLDDVAAQDDLVIEACGALWSWTAKLPMPNTNVTTQLLRSILGLCARHKGDGGGPMNSAILTEASGALSSIMHCVRENPVHIPDNDIDLIISVLDLVIEFDVDNVVLMERMLDSVQTLCFLVKEILIQFGVIVVVIDCMVEHEGNEVIQQKGCAILALLASTENLQVNLSIAETDGIDMIVSALAGFTENICIQTDACRALSHLSIDHESRMLISSQGGLILLVNAMTRYKDDVDLLEAACSALLNLSSDAEEQVLASSNVVETVILIMRHQITCARLQEKTLGVLQNISMRSRDAKKSIADVGGISAVTFAIKEFMGSPGVLERAFTTLWSLAVLEDNQILIANEGGISLVVNGMMANITYEKVQKQACGCLCTLSSNSRNKTLIRDLGGVDSIVYAMWAHYNSDALLIEACRGLSSLAVNVQTNEVMIATDGEISAIMSAMKRFPHSEKLQEHACVALRNFLLSADNAALVRHQADELERLMNAASSRFPDRCAERARQVLASIR